MGFNDFNENFNSNNASYYFIDDSNFDEIDSMSVDYVNCVHLNLLMDSHANWTVSYVFIMMNSFYHIDFNEESMHECSLVFGSPFLI